MHIRFNEFRWLHSLAGYSDDEWMDGRSANRNGRSYGKTIRRTGTQLDERIEGFTVRRRIHFNGRRIGHKDGQSTDRRKQNEGRTEGRPDVKADDGGTAAEGRSKGWLYVDDQTYRRTLWLEGGHWDGWTRRGVDRQADRRTDEQSGGVTNRQIDRQRESHQSEVNLRRRLFYMI